MKRYYPVAMVAGILLLGIVAAFATPVIHRWWKQPVTPNPPAAAIAPKYTKEQQGILSEMIRIVHREMSLQEFYVNGHMDAHNQADSGNDVHAPFTCNRRAQEYYYKVGDNEMVALPNMFININHDLKKMTVSGPQQLMMPALVPEQDLEKMWEGERYEITADTVQSKVRIKLLCERHVSCKEFRMEYDTTLRLPSLLYMRMTDLDAPLNKDADKIYQLTIDQWQTTAVPGLFMSSRYVNGANGHWTPAGRFAGYDLSTSY